MESYKAPATLGAAMGRRSDATVAATVLVVVLAGSLAVDARPAPFFVAVGAAGAVLLEGLTQLRPALVRRLWVRPLVQAVGVAGTLAAAAGGYVLVGPAALWVVAGGLGGYLALLGAVAVLVRAPRRQPDR
jgi:hypothetical protein